MRIIYTLCLVCLLFGARAQQISQTLLSTGGGNFYQVYAKMDWSIGEPVIEYFKRDYAYLSQGFIQNFRTNFVGTNEVFSNDLNIAAYPNPFKEHFEIAIDGIKPNAKVDMQLYDILGKPVYSKSNIKPNELIHPNDISNGLYLLVVSINGTTVKTIRIEKIY